MRRAMLLLAGAAALCGSLLPGRAWAQAEEQALVDRATLTVQEMLGVGDPNILRDAQDAARRARAAMICPRVFRAGFLIGGQGGPCVLVARDGAGSWSGPAFYGMGAGSIGLQIGIQDMQILMLIMTDRGLRAIMENQFKLGADASVAVATIGGGINGSTTSAVGADVVAYARSRGLFLGIALEGSIFTRDAESNRNYYGRDVVARQIVVEMQAYNPGSDPLRAALMQHSARAN
ncbi:lipid-binding SYLF domain-containing protein [Roseomonas sp. BN140053]|uniref:lipid-binding SYLF domain-containing protein n=1 Tax=Roseomonas sp. BN140053 TaxID=3391898 RepID=UPI0039E8F6E1